MIKEIQYAGYATEPSDYECPDGQLATSLNLISEDNQLKPVFQPSEQAVLPDGYKVMYIHDANTFTHYIIIQVSTNKLYWIDESVVTEAAQKPVTSDEITNELAKTNPSHELHSFGATEIYNVNGIGNTLVALTDEGMFYFLWKEKKQGYIFLGTHLPEMPISFGLQGEMVGTDTFRISFDNISETELWKEFNESNKKKISEQVLAKVNKFIAEQSVNEGKFIYPFLVRYAYRLYDGSLTMHSAPVLMVCSSDLAPQVFCDHIKGKNGEYTLADLRIVGVKHTLDYAVIHSTRIDMIKNWKDIVRSVDIFISKPIYTYDQNGQCQKFTKSDEVKSYSICKHINQTADKNKYPIQYQENTFNKMYAFTFSPDDLSYPSGRLMLPKRSTEQVKADIRACSQFYILKSVKIDELSTNRTEVAVEEDYLKSLVTREVMTDDYDSHDTLIPQYAFGYNARMNIANIKKKLYNTYNIGALCCFTDGYVTAGVAGTGLNNKSYWGVYFFIKQNGKDIIVHGENFMMSQVAKILFLYYPNVNAYKAVFFNSQMLYNTFEVPMEAHSFLNGAFYFGGWENSQKNTTKPIASNDKETIVEIANKIYTSEVNNPFHFPLLGINTVGTGKILGMSAAAKALSQGQFGQFPLYAFTTEGVWALEVSPKGSYSARQPITRDVCINTKSITQLDSAVLFATDRGIMEISGSQTQCITDSIFAEMPFDVTTLQSMDKLHAMLGIGHDADACVPVQSFLRFLEHCQMLYDYVHQRIFVFNPTQVTKDGVTKANYNYAYVYSLKSKQWGMVYSNLNATINSYPDALAMTQDNKLVSFSETDEDESKGLYITRPLKLDAADVHKTISTIIQRGHFQRGDVATVLYGSRDLYNWKLIWSSKDHYLRGFRGTPYKYFRIAGMSKLTEGKSIFGASLNFEMRHNNQLR